MTETEDLYQLAQKEGIPIIGAELPENGSLAIQTDSARCYIGMDTRQLSTQADQRVHLAHELGHCMTGSFYNRWAALDVRQRHEQRADKWAIQQTIPPQALEAALASGITETWQLADHFGVTEDFIRKAVCWYHHGTLDTQDYFGL